MKRLLWCRKTAWLCGVLCLLLSGCQTPAAVPPVTEHVSYRVTADYGELSLVGTLNRPAAGQLTLAIEQPGTLKGVSLHWNNRVLTADWHGLTMELDDKTLPKAALIRKLAEILDTAVSTPATSTDTDAQLKGTVGTDSFTLSYDPETGYLRSLSVPTLSLMARFEPIL